MVLSLARGIVWAGLVRRWMNLICDDDVGRLFDAIHEMNFTIMFI